MTSRTASVADCFRSIKLGRLISKGYMTMGRDYPRWDYPHQAQKAGNVKNGKVHKPFGENKDKRNGESPHATDDEEESLPKGHDDNPDPMDHSDDDEVIDDDDAPFDGSPGDDVMDTDEEDSTDPLDDEDDGYADDEVDPLDDDDTATY